MNHLMQPRTMLQKSQAGHSKYASSHQLCLHHIICPPPPASIPFQPSHRTGRTSPRSRILAITIPSGMFVCRTAATNVCPPESDARSCRDIYTWTGSNDARLLSTGLNHQHQQPKSSRPCRPSQLYILSIYPGLATVQYVVGK